MSKIEDEVCEKIHKRSKAGLKKYGVTLERNDFDFTDWIIHLQEELMDASVYAQKIIYDFKGNKREKAIKQILEDMVYVAKQDGWDKSTTGRQLILRDAEKLLKDIGCE